MKVLSNLERSILQTFATMKARTNATFAWFVAAAIAMLLLLAVWWVVSVFTTTGIEFLGGLGMHINPAALVSIVTGFAAFGLYIYGERHNAGLCGLTSILLGLVSIGALIAFAREALVFALIAGVGVGTVASWLWKTCKRGR